MPEGDTVFVAAERLRRALAGRVVSRFDLRVPGLALANLAGSTVESVAPIGKHLLMRFSTGQTLHSHLRMDGSWLVGAADRRVRAPDHTIRALIGNDEWLAAGVRVHDLALVDTSDEATLVGHLGPDLAQPEPDLDEAVRRFAAQPGQLIADALLDQRLSAGIGNVYKSELLFLHRIDPWSTVAAVGDDVRAVLVDAARLLRANLGGFNRSTTGWRQSGQQYWVYGRQGRGCRRCGTAIGKDTGAGANTDRITYFCPSCQGVAARQ